MKNIAFLFALLSFSQFAYAECNDYQCSGVTNTFLQSLKTTQNEVMLGFPAGVNAALNCELYTGGYAKVNASSPLFSSQHSIVLTALVSNAPLAVRFDETAPFCTVSEVEILVVE